jgi:hypothetical protein
MQDDGITTEDDRYRGLLRDWAEEFTLKNGWWPNPLDLAACLGQMNVSDNETMKLMSLFMEMKATNGAVPKTGWRLWWYTRTYPEQRRIVSFIVGALAGGLALILIPADVWPW